MMCDYAITEVKKERRVKPEICHIYPYAVQQREPKPLLSRFRFDRVATVYIVLT